MHIILEFNKWHKQNIPFININYSFLNCIKYIDYINFFNQKRVNNGYVSADKQSKYRKMYRYPLFSNSIFQGPKIHKNKVLSWSFYCLHWYWCWYNVSLITLIWQSYHFSQYQSSVLVTESCFDFAWSQTALDNRWHFESKLYFPPHEIHLHGPLEPVSRWERTTFTGVSHSYRFIL